MSDEAAATAAPPGSSFVELVAVMDVLRRTCPWDARQTHRSLARYLVEETYEMLEAIELDDSTALREELGDVLLQVLFHARIAAEAPGSEAFDIDDVARGLQEKLVTRHPHVFAADTPAGAARTAGDVQVRWEEIKAEEKARSSVLEGVPMALPSLALAEKLVGRARRVGVNAAEVAAESGGVGGELLGLAIRAHAAGTDPEQALRDANRALMEAIRAAETPE